MQCSYTNIHNEAQELYYWMLGDQLYKYMQYINSENIQHTNDILSRPTLLTAVTETVVKVQGRL